MTKTQNTTVKGWVMNYPHTNLFLYELQFLSETGHRLRVFMTPHVRTRYEDLFLPNAYLSLSGLMEHHTDELFAKRARFEHPDGPWQLPAFDGYTLDFRVSEFRHEAHGVIDFIPFSSAEGQQLFTDFRQYLRRKAGEAA